MDVVYIISTLCNNNNHNNKNVNGTHTRRNNFVHHEAVQCSYYLRKFTENLLETHAHII